MKKLLLTAVTAFIILFAQAQMLCQSNFSYSQNGPTTVFTDLSTLSSWNTFSWDFGDGNASTLQNPTHTYSNGIYSPCLTVTFFDTLTGNICTSIYCDSILIGNGQTASWDCSPVSGCYDPGTGQGTLSTYLSCDSACTLVSANFACMGGVVSGVNTCVGPGNFVMGQTYVMGVYPTMAACIADSCNVTVLTTSWDCDPLTGCYDPGTGTGQYTTLAACQAVCSNTTSVYCDSMIVNGSQTQCVFEIIGLNIPVDYWISTANDGTVLGEDSMSTYHMVYNNPGTSMMPYDTINVCITYADAIGYYTCCVTWVWDAASGMWAKMGGVTSVAEINSDNKKLIKIVDVLGRETFPKNNEILFYIYEDGTIDKRYIKE